MNRIQILREHIGLNKTELGRAVGVSRQAVMKWEKQIADPKGEVLKRLEKVLGVDGDYILCGTDDPKEEDRLPPDWVQTVRKAMRHFTPERVDRILEGFLMAEGRSKSQDPEQ